MGGATYLNQLWSVSFDNHINALAVAPDDTLYVAFQPSSTIPDYGVWAFDVSSQPDPSNPKGHLAMPWPVADIAVSGDYLVGTGGGHILFIDRFGMQLLTRPDGSLPILSSSDTVTASSSGTRLFAPQSGQGEIGVYTPKAKLSGGTPPSQSVSGP